MLKRTIAVLTDALFPPKCLICGRFLALQSKTQSLRQRGHLAAVGRSPLSQKEMFKALMAPFLCSTCGTGFLPVESPFCSRCGFVFTSREGEDHVCGECLASPKRFRIARSAGIYQQSLLAVLHGYKYRGKIQLARPLAAILFFVLQKNWQKDRIDFVVPVPLHRGKMKRRGFNQVGLMLSRWNRMAIDFGADVPYCRIDDRILVRTRWTRPQAGLGRKQRIDNIKNAFQVNAAARVAGKRVLLVDDIYTTGATVDECAGVLLKNGVESVDVLTLARAI